MKGRVSISHPLVGTNRHQDRDGLLRLTSKTRRRPRTKFMRPDAPDELKAQPLRFLTRCLPVQIAAAGCFASQK